MDESERKITKIARVAQRYAALRLRDVGLGTSENECLRHIRKAEGLTQEQLATLLNIDKSAVTRMMASLEKKGYIERRASKTDGRARLVFATARAHALRGETHTVEADFYEWLLREVSGRDREAFLRVLEGLYQKSREERRAGFRSLIEEAEDV